MSKMEERSPERPYGILAEFAQLQKEREGQTRTRDENPKARPVAPTTCPNTQALPSS